MNKDGLMILVGDLKDAGQLRLTAAIRTWRLARREYHRQIAVGAILKNQNTVDAANEFFARREAGERHRDKPDWFEEARADIERQRAAEG